MTQQTPHALLSYEDVVIHRGDRQLFQPLSFQVTAGDKLVLSAPVGGGKSSALLASIGAVQPTSGRVICLGEDISKLAPKPLLHHRRRVGYVPATGGLLANLNLFDNLTLLLRYLGDLSKEEVERRANQACDDLGLPPLHGRPYASADPEELHLIAIARAWLTTPSLLILDDPDHALDDESTEDLWSRLATLRRRHDVAILVGTSRPAPALRHGGRHLTLQPFEDE